MNSKLDFIFARRSVRKYRDQEVSDEHVRDLLEAAMAAPSACGKDPWEFTIVRDKQMLERIVDKLPNAPMLPSANVGIVICGDIRRAHDGQEPYMLQDCAAAIQNILLAASTLGLGACWLGIYPREERMQHIRELLNLSEHVIPVSAISIGWPAETPEPRTRYNEAYVHRV